MTRILDAAELATLAGGLAARPELWRPHLRPDPARRTFHALVREPHATVWLICWMAGHDTGFHDHDGAGEVFSFGPHDIHRVSHVEGAPAVTIHAYSPELKRMGAYDVGPDGLLQRRALDETVELKAAA